MSTDPKSPMNPTTETRDPALMAFLREVDENWWSPDDAPFGFETIGGATFRMTTTNLSITSIREAAALLEAHAQALGVNVRAYVTDVEVEMPGIKFHGVTPGYNTIRFEREEGTYTGGDGTSPGCAICLPTNMWQIRNAYENTFGGAASALGWSLTRVQEAIDSVFGYITAKQTPTRIGQPTTITTGSELLAAAAERLGVSGILGKQVNGTGIIVYLDPRGHNRATVSSGRDGRCTVYLDGCQQPERGLISSFARAKEAMDYVVEQAGITPRGQSFVARVLN
jgi:hypothetical protein